MYEKRVRAAPGEIAELAEFSTPEGDSAFLVSVHVVLIGGKDERCARVVNVTREGSVLILRGAGSDECAHPAYRVWPEASAGRLRLLVWSRSLPIVASLLSLTPMAPPGPSPAAKRHDDTRH